MCPADAGDRPSVRSHYLSLLEQTRELFVEYLRNDRLTAEKLVTLERLIRSNTFLELPTSTRSRLESSFYLLRIGLVALTLAANGRPEHALERLLSGFEEVDAFDGDADPFDGLIFALAARLAQVVGREDLERALMHKVEWFARNDEERDRRLLSILDELGN